MAYDIGPKIGIEGEAEFRRSIRQINDEYKTLRTEMEAVSSAFDKNDKSQENLTEQNKVLNKQIDLQKQKLKEVTAVLEKCKKEYGENDAKTLAWQRTVNKTETELNKLEGRLESNNTALKTNQSHWESAGKSIDNFGSKAGLLGDKLTGIGNRMTAGITVPVVGAGVAATKLASDYEEALNKTDVAFGASSETVKQFADTTLDKFGIARGSALDMASLFGDMATSMGLTQQAAAEMGIELVGRAGDLASFKNIGLEQAQTALAGIFTGETESLKTLGVVMTQTNLDAYALANGFGKTTAEMTEAEKVNLRFQYVMNATRNSAGDFARTSDGTANSTRVFKESLKELGETFGQELLPVVTPFIQEATDLIKQFGALDSQTKKNIITAGGLLAVAGPALTGIGKVSSGVSSLSKLLGSGGLFGKLADTTSGTTKLTSGMKGLLPVLGKMGGGAKTATTALSGLSVGAVGLAAGIPALLTGFGSWYTHMLTIRDGSQEVIDKSREVAEQNDQLTANITANMEQRQTALDNLVLEKETTGALVGELFRLVDVYGGTQNAQAVLQPTIDALNQKVQGLNLSWDGQTQSLNMTRDEITKVIEAQARQLEMQEKQQQAVQIFSDLTEAERVYNEAVQAGQEIKNKQNEILGQAVEKYKNVNDEQQRSKLIYDYYKSHVIELNQEQQKNNETLKESADRVNSLRGEYENTLSAITGEPVKKFEQVKADMFQGGADGIQAYINGANGQLTEAQKNATAMARATADATNTDEVKQKWSLSGFNLGEIFRGGLNNTKTAVQTDAGNLAKSGADSALMKQPDFSSTGGILGSTLSSALLAKRGEMRVAGESIANDGRAGYNIGIGNSGDSEGASGNFASKMLNKIKGVFGIHSPSKEMEWVGSMVGTGFINGLLNTEIGQIAQGIATDVLNAFNSGQLGLSNFLEALGGGIEGVKSFVNFATSKLGSGLAGIANNLFGSFFSKGGVTPKTDMMWVSDSRDITSWFGYRDDVAGVGSSNHGGIDIGAPYGSPIYAPASGNVISAGWNGGYGNAVTIQLDNGFEVLFGHMSGFAVGSGQRVNPGQIVGYVGSTGNSTGPHIHYSVFLNGQAIDPAQFYGFSVGSRYVPYDMPAIVHRGEMIVPRSENPYANSGGSITGGFKNEIVDAVVQALSTQKGNVTFNQTIVSPEYSPSQIRRQTERLLNGAFSPV